MSKLRFLANMNISPDTVAALRKMQWDIYRVSERLPVNASDLEIIELARLEERVIVTQYLDFSTLIALRGWDKPSLVTLRLFQSDPERVTRKLLSVIADVDRFLQEGSAVTVEDTTTRIRKLPI